MRTRGKKLLGILLSLMLVVGMLPAMSMTVHADDDQEPVKYLVGNEERTCTSYTLVTNSNTTVEWPYSWYVVKGDVTIAGRVSFSGTINLILCDNAKLTLGDGIGTLGGRDINIYAQSTGNNMGKLIVNGNSDHGIRSAFGNLTIYGGNIDASTSGMNTYAIGSDSSAVNIYGGEVKANGGYYGAAIVAHGNSKISGGTVNADGGNRSIVVTAGDLEITGGNITANKDIRICNGHDEYPPTNKGGNLTISGGTVTVNGGEHGIYSEANITISGGTVTAKKDSLNPGCAITSNGDFNISGGKVEATGNGLNRGTIDIWGAIYISGDSEVTAIGSENANYGIEAIEGFHISGGKLTATGRLEGIYFNDILEISGGTVEATGNDGIRGSGNIEISGGSVKATGDNYGAGIYLYEGKVLTVTGGTVTATGDLAIDGTIINEISGTGWTNREGTEGMKLIPVNTSGDSYSYDKIQFPALAAKVTTPPKAKTLTFTGQAQELIDAGVAENGTMLYALSEDADTEPTSWSEAVPTGTEAKTYYVWYYAKGADQYDNSAKDKIAVTIKSREALEGNGQTVRPGFPARFRFDIDYKEFLARGAVYVDGNPVDSKHYDSSEGSTIITLKEEFIDSLSEGSHTVTITLSGVSVGDATFNVTKAAPETVLGDESEVNGSPATGDSISNILLLFLISFIGLTSIGLYTKKKELFK